MLAAQDNGVNVIAYSDRFIISLNAILLVESSVRSESYHPWTELATHISASFVKSRRSTYLPPVLERVMSKTGSAVVLAGEVVFLVLLVHEFLTARTRWPLTLGYSHVVVHNSAIPVTCNEGYMFAGTVCSSVWPLRRTSRCVRHGECMFFLLYRGIS